MTTTPEPRKRGRPRKVATEPQDEFKLRRANLHERATERLRTMIVRGKLEPGTSLVEVDLCDMLNVSRTPLREAMKILAAQGLIELRANRSARISPMSEESIADLFEVMSNIERLAAELAALRISQDDLATLHALQNEIERYGRAGELDGYFASNQKIHSLIVVASGSAALREVHELLFPRTEWARYFALSSMKRWRESIDEHNEILKALDARRSKKAGRLMAEHVLHTRKEVLDILSKKAAQKKAAA